MDYFLTKLVTDFKSIFLLLFVLIVLSHLLLIYMFRINKKAWLFIEYGALFFASLGLITITAEIRTNVAKSNLKSTQAKLEFTFSQLKYYVHDGSPAYICRTFVRSQLSPPNFDHVQKEYSEACNWYKKLNSILPESVTPDFPPLDLDSLRETDFSDPVIVESIRWIKTLIRQYERERMELIEAKRKATPGNFESAMYFLSPLFICITLAITITKTTWNLKQLYRRGS